jgi:hypothetical protein
MKQARSQVAAHHHPKKKAWVCSLSFTVTAQRAHQTSLVEGFRSGELPVYRFAARRWPDFLMASVVARFSDLRAIQVVLLMKAASTSQWCASIGHEVFPHGAGCAHPQRGTCTSLALLVGRFVIAQAHHTQSVDTIYRRGCTAR